MQQTTKKRLCILGATGSIGDSTLDLVRQHRDDYQVVALTGFARLDKLLHLCVEFHPKFVVLADETCQAQFVQKLSAAKQNHPQLDPKVLIGQQGLQTVASLAEVDIVVAAIVGAAGLPSVLSAVQSAKTVLLANKEALVMAGKLVIQTAKTHGATILPIDSEHNAIFQCLPSQVQQHRDTIHDKKFGIVKLHLTASGGSFLHKSYEDMRKASVADAIKHPNWSMGQKISVDSSTMMNKGLELIEACHLFGLDESQIEVVIHPESIIHSMVEYSDGSILAQLGSPDMKTPIAHALAYPWRMTSGVQRLDLFKMAQLTFLPPDMQKFACLRLAREALRLGGGACIVLNAANEVAVSAFLAGKIALTDIAVLVEKCLKNPALAHSLSQDFDDEKTALQAILALDNKVRALAESLLDDGFFDDTSDGKLT